MPRHSLVKQYKLLAIALAPVFFLAGCERVAIPSVDIPTEEVFVDYSVDAYETSTSSSSAWYYTTKNMAISQALDDISLSNRVDLDLSDLESCEASVNDEAYLMESFKDQNAELQNDPRALFLFTTSPIWHVISEMSINVFGSHLNTTLPALSTDDEIMFTFYRVSGEVLHSSATVGEYPVITFPADGATIQRTVDKFTVAWNALSAREVPLKLNVGVRCAQDFTWTEDEFVELSELAYDAENGHMGSVTVDLEGGSTSHVVSRADLMKNVIVPDGVTVCGGTISLSYTSRGALAPEVKGGKVEVRHNAKKVGFLFKL